MEAHDKAQVAKLQKGLLFECPIPAYVRDRQIKRVAEWFCGGDGEQAERMLQSRPARFHEVLGWANAEADAEEINEKWSEWKRKNKTEGDALAQPNAGGNLAQRAAVAGGSGVPRLR